MFRGGQKVTTRRERSRGQEIAALGRDLPLVPLPEGETMLAALLDYGPAKPAPMGGLDALSWPDVQAIAALGLVPDADHAHLLRDMSLAYCREAQGDGSALSIPPVERGQ